MTAALLALLLASPALADKGADGEEAPEFLLGDVGVRIDLPSGWNMTRWSDWDFKAETSDKAVALFAWTTPIQATPAKPDLDAWGALYQEKATELGGGDPKVAATHLGTRQGTPVAEAEVDFTFGGGTAMKLYGGAFPVEGQVFHVATIATRARGKRAEAARDEILDALEVHKAAAAADTGDLVVDGVTMHLPEGFRAPLESELPKIVPHLTKLGVEDPAKCGIAIRTHGPDEPDVLATCQGGLWLGKVDSYTFDDKEAELRPHLFGRAEVPAATAVALSDRTGFHYHLDVGEESMHLGVVPYDQGLSRTWLIGASDHAGDHAELLEAAMTGASYSGPHPVSLADEAGYILYRPTYMAAAGGVGLVLLGGLALGIGFLVRRSGSKYEDIE